MKSIPLTHGEFAIVDDEDYEKLIKIKWHASTRGKTCYAISSKGVAMHRMLLGVPKGLMVDHINGDGFDNRRQNIRICTRSQNGCNRERTRISKTGYKGVFIENKKFLAFIKILGKGTRIGLFSSAEEAARAYDKFAKERHGTFARLNFPD